MPPAPYISQIQKKINFFVDDLKKNLYLLSELRSHIPNAHITLK